MSRKGNRAAIGHPVTFTHAYAATSPEIVIDVHNMLKSTDATRDMKCVLIRNLQDAASASIDGFALEPRGWPKLQELEIMRMECALFPKPQLAPSFSAFPALQVLRLSNVPGLIDGQIFFAGLSQMPRLRELHLILILFRKLPDSQALPLLFLRLQRFFFVQKNIFNPEGTAVGWHRPILAPARPRFLQLLLTDVHDLAPLFEDPSCLSEMIELSFLEEHRETSRCLPLVAYAGIPALCPKLREVNLSGPCDSLYTTLAMMLATLKVPLRAVHLEFWNTPVPTREALGEVDRMVAELLRTAQPLAHLRRFSITTFFTVHGILDLEFPALRNQCLLRGAMFDREEY